MSALTALEALPTDGLTVTVLRTLDRIVPGEWDNVTSVDALAREVCGPEAPPKLALQLAVTARQLSLRDGEKYNRALQIYRMVDTVDQAAAAGAMMGKAADLFGSLGFLKKVTPKPDTTQALDAGVKLVAELVAFGTLNGMPTADADGLQRFTGALADYARYDLVRVASWVVFDGMLPLGPGFVSKIISTWKDVASSKFAGNAAFQTLAGQLPGDTMDDKRGFAIQALDKTGDWVTRFVADKGITQGKVLDQLQGAMSVADGGLDYVAAAIDASTSYFSHTGTQTVARAVVRHALDERREQVWKGYLDTLR